MERMPAGPPPNGGADRMPPETEPTVKPPASDPEDAVAIRPATPGDAPTLIDFQLRLARESEGLALDPEVLRRGVLGVFEDPVRGRYWVAEAAGRMVGGLLATREWSDWRAGTVVWVQSVYVVPEARRRGIYRRLYERLRREVEASPDLKGIRLYVDKTNTPAQRAYERLGMTRDHYDLYEWLKG
jgi:ribosomal protein S18 acetylase RimI-like enzyme